LAHTEEGDTAKRHAMLLDLLTPVAKTYPSEMGIHSVSQGLQILGGYGYCQEFPLEQYYRDIRIHTIHEGTTGIQGLDLLGRKVMANNGAALRIFLDELQAAMDSASSDDYLKPYAERLNNAVELVRKVTMHRIQSALKGDIEEFLADATLYLELFGIVAIAWQWLVQGIAARAALGGEVPKHDVGFYEGKLQTMRYFFHYELPKTHGLAARLLENDAITVGTTSAIFDD
ncbi:MAG: acyl-CoA dehydrogenase, partial [Pseudomonadota bacterium]